MKPYIITLATMTLGNALAFGSAAQAHSVSFENTIQPQPASFSSALIVRDQLPDRALYYLSNAGYEGIVCVVKPDQIYSGVEGVIGRSIDGDEGLETGKCAELPIDDDLILIGLDGFNFSINGYFIPKCTYSTADVSSDEIDLSTLVGVSDITKACYVIDVR